MRDVLSIRLYEPMVECRLCGAEAPHSWGVPMYEGNLLSNDFQGEWFGAPACKQCFEAHARGDLPTFDRLYTTEARPVYEVALREQTAKMLRVLGRLKRLPKVFRGLRGCWLGWRSVCNTK